MLSQLIKKSAELKKRQKQNGKNKEKPKQQSARQTSDT